MWLRKVSRDGSARTRLPAAVAGVTAGVLLAAGLAVPVAAASAPTVEYRGHVQSIGWQRWVGGGTTAGTSGRGLRVEALQLKVANSSLAGSVECRAHVQNIGWMAWTGAGTTCGTSGRGLRVEAIQVRLTGELASEYDVYYRTHVQSYGWLGWASNGGAAGSQGGAKRMEAVQVKLVARGAKAPGATSNALVQGVTYAGHVQNIGWQSSVSNGASAGTTGQGLRVEALKLSVPGASGGIECRAHVQNIGWMGWVGAGQVCGTSGRGLRVEAIQVRLTGAVANQYDVYYRTHAQDKGWLGWASNGAQSGTAGGAKRLEAIQVTLVRRGDTAPTSAVAAFLDLTPVVSVVGGAGSSGNGSWDCPADRPIKGNASSKIYHVPSGAFYSRTNPEQCFATESAARAAGYRKSKV